MVNKGKKIWKREKRCLEFLPTAQIHLIVEILCNRWNFRKKKLKKTGQKLKNGLNTGNLQGPKRL